MTEEQNISFTQVPPQTDFDSQCRSSQIVMPAEQLQTAIGYYVSCEFLIGTQLLETRNGILTKIGTNFLTLSFSPTSNGISSATSIRLNS